MKSYYIAPWKLRGTPHNRAQIASEYYLHIYIDCKHACDVLTIFILLSKSKRTRPISYGDESFFFFCNGMFFPEIFGITLLFTQHILIGVLVIYTKVMNNDDDTAIRCQNGTITYIKYIYIYFKIIRVNVYTARHACVAIKQNQIDRLLSMYPTTSNIFSLRCILHFPQISSYFENYL